MKKIIFVFITTLVMLVVPFNVMADMGAPIVNSYDAYVNNPDGASYYEYKGGKLVESGKLDYNTKIKVVYEDNTYATFEIGNKSVDILLKDIIAIKDSYSFNEKDVIDMRKENEYARVLNKDGINLYSGPSKAYKVLDVIPYWENIQLKYVLQSDDIDFWYGVEYNGKVGWVEYLDGKLGELSNSEYYVFNDAKVYKSLSKKDSDLVSVLNKGTTIKKGQVLTLDPWVRYSIYVKINDDICGYTSYDNVYRIVNKNVVTKDDIDLYSIKVDDLEEDNSKKIMTIPAGSSIKVMYENGNSNYYIEYNNKKGWIFDLYIDEVITNESNETTTKVTTTKSDIKNKKEVKLSLEQIILISVFLAFILALTAIIILIYINKKKQNNDQSQLIDNINENQSNNNM